MITNHASRFVFDALHLERGAAPREAMEGKQPFDVESLPRRAYSMMVVCDGWTEPRHARIVLRDGDPARVSHGMCAECEEKMK